MSRTRLIALLVLVVALAGAAGWAFWNYDLRWRPKTVTRHQAEIVRLLESSGWASPGLQGKRLYVIAYADCPACGRLEAETFPKLAAKNVDTRLIMVARRDRNGVRNSSAAERATVAQIWLTHDWRLLQRWQAAPAAWAAQGIPRADGDMARSAVVEAGRRMVDDLTPLMKANGVKFAYPLLVWWDDKGRMRACACERPETYRFVLKDLGA
jgi:hypothetical protein